MPNLRRNPLKALIWAILVGSGWLPSPVLLVSIGLRVWISRPLNHLPIYTPCRESTTDGEDSYMEHHPLHHPSRLTLKNITVDVTSEERDFYRPAKPPVPNDKMSPEKRTQGEDMLSHNQFGRLSPAHAKLARETFAKHGVVVLRRALPVVTMHKAFTALHKPCRVDYINQVEVCEQGTRTTVEAMLWRYGGGLSSTFLSRCAKWLKLFGRSLGAIDSSLGTSHGGGTRAGFCKRRRLEPVPPLPGVHTPGTTEARSADEAAEILRTQEEAINEPWAARLRRHELLSLTEPPVHAVVGALRRFVHEPVLMPFLAPNPDAEEIAGHGQGMTSEDIDSHGEKAPATLVELSHVVSLRGAEPEAPERSVYPRHGDAPLINAVVYVEDVTASMSPIEVWPGSHLCTDPPPYYRHYHRDPIRGEPLHEEIEREHQYQRNGITVAAPLGTVILMDSRLVRRERGQAGRLDRHAIYLSVAGGNPKLDVLPSGPGYAMLPEQWGLPRTKNSAAHGSGRDYRAELYWKPDGYESSDNGRKWWSQTDVLRTVLLELWEHRQWLLFTGELTSGVYHILQNLLWD